MPAFREHLAVAQKRALLDQQEAQERFKEWAKSRVPDAEFMNVGSGTQIRQLMFAGVPNNRTDKRENLEMERAFKACLTMALRYARLAAG